MAVYGKWEQTQSNHIWPPQLPEQPVYIPSTSSWSSQQYWRQKPKVQVCMILNLTFFLNSEHGVDVRRANWPMSWSCGPDRGVRYIDKQYRLSTYRPFLKVSISISISKWPFLKISISISIRPFLKISISISIRPETSKLQ